METADPKEQFYSESDVQAWIKTLETTFAPYPAFIESVASAIEELSRRPVEAEAPREEKQRMNAEPVAVTSAPKKQKLPEKRVLLVDDAEINRVLMSHYFKGYPIKLEFAINSEAACDRCGKQGFDLIVIDFDHNAEAVIRSLQNAQVSVPMVALSSHAFSSEEEAKALSFGFKSFLTRGYPKEELLSRLKQVLWSNAS